MLISIIVITKNEERNIGNCLDSLIKLDYPDKKYEIIIVDGNSKDITQKIVKKYMNKYKIIKLVIDKKDTQQTSRNLGIKKSKYDYIAFTDADCIVPRNWLKILIHNFKKYRKIYSNLAGVGGANIPPKDTNKFIKAIGIAFNSFLGSLGSIQAKKTTKDKKVFSISCSNSFYKKSRLKDVGLFTVIKGKPGDDWELGLKMKERGYLLFALKDSFVWHKFRSTPSKFWKNMFLYGKVRAEYIKRFPKENGMLYFIPLIFILGMFSIVFSFFHRIFLLPLLYFPLIFLYSFYLCIKNKNKNLTLIVFFIFLLQHFGYGLGMVKNIFK